LIVHSSGGKGDELISSTDELLLLESRVLDDPLLLLRLPDGPASSSDMSPDIIRSTLWKDKKNFFGRIFSV
jgi:hypothetical protein